MSAKYMVCVVSEDSNVGNALKGPFKSAGLTLISYANVPALLHALDEDKPIGCLIGELRGGLDLLKELAGNHCVVPVVLLASTGTVTAAVQAVKSGAFDVVEKPEAAVESAKNGIALYVKCKQLFEDRCAATARIESLTKRETQVLNLMVEGKPNRVIAEELGISSKTLDIHRANLMDKMEARTTADMCRAFLLAKTDPMQLHLLA